MKMKKVEGCRDLDYIVRIMKSDTNNYLYCHVSFSAKPMKLID